MLTIRRSQLEALGEHARAQFTAGLVAAIAHHYPRQCAKLGAEGTQALVERTIERAARHNIRTRGAVTAFVELVLEFGEEFRLSPDRKVALKLLAHPVLADAVKVQAIQDRLRERTGGRMVVPVDEGVA